jgi:transposase
MDWVKIRLTPQQKEEIKEAERQIENKQLLKRLQCIKLKDKKWKHKEIMEFLGVSLSTVSIWIKVYTQEGMQALLKWNYAGKVSLLGKEQQEIIRKRHEEKPFLTAKEAKAFIKEKFGIEWNVSWIQKLLKKNFDFRIKR